MIVGLLISVSSVYLNKVVFADDNWSDVAKRQLEQNNRAAMIYNDKYQFANLVQTSSSYAGLSSFTTDETSKGRDLIGQSQMSLENALAEFDKIHVRWLNTTQNTGYAGLTSVSTDESNARDRNAMIAQAINQTDQQLASLASQLGQIQQSYQNMSGAVSTDEKAISRQAQIEQTWNNMEAQAAALVNSISKVNSAYLNLAPGASTNENTVGRQLTQAEAHAMQNAVTIFEEIHANRLAALGSNYDGLTSSTTNENVYADRNVNIETATEMALQNAINFYNAYYPSTPTSQPNYSH
jgi:hypothetical protein